MAKKRYYAVKNGRETGVFEVWSECEASVKGYPGAIYKSFSVKEDALRFLEGEEDAEPQDTTRKAAADIEEVGYAFVDGSFNPGTGVYGAGGFLVDDDGQKHIIQGSGSDPEMAAMRNVAGEVLGAKMAIQKAISLGMQKVVLYYDYSGVECWATGAWKRNKAGTKEYYEFCQDAKSTIEIQFQKVKGHSGVDGNEEADRLAKQAAGI